MKKKKKKLEEIGSRFDLRNYLNFAALRIRRFGTPMKGQKTAGRQAGLYSRVAPFLQIEDPCLSSPSPPLPRDHFLELSRWLGANIAWRFGT